MPESLKTLSRLRILEEMLANVKASGGAEWSVLIMDELTTRITSTCARISDVLDYGVSLVDEVTKRRQPMPNLSGVYFISDSRASVLSIIRDFEHKPLYKTAHIFFSSYASEEHIKMIKNCRGLVARLKSLQQVHLEYLVCDSQTFSTKDDEALSNLFGEIESDDYKSYDKSISVIAERLATALTTLQANPNIRFRTALPSSSSDSLHMENLRHLDHQSLVSQKIAVTVDGLVSKLQESGQVPSEANCDLIILDRGYDAVAPIIHEWTYEAMVHDLFDVENNVYRYEVETEGGATEWKSHLLDESDPVWRDVRHQHFADASIYISAKLDDFREKNKAASYISGRHGAMDKNALGMKDMKNLVKALPQYREQLTRLSVHVDIARRINKIIDDYQLVTLGRLEQDLVYGSANSKDVINFLGMNPNMSAENKLRLLMCYLITHPEKLDEAKKVQWQKLTRLNVSDMEKIVNLEYLGVPVQKRGNPSGLPFNHKRKRLVRKERVGGKDDEQKWDLARFNPILADLLEDLLENNLSTDHYPYVRTPGKPGHRSKPSNGWAKRAAGISTAEDSRHVLRGHRIVIFVVGGLTRSEMRVIHSFSEKHNRDIYVGGTSILTPKLFLHNLQGLSSYYME